MNQLQNPSGAQLAHYIHEAMLLLQSIVFNEFDRTTLAGGPKRSVTYLLDADIVHMFMHPADNTKYVDVFDFEAEKEKADLAKPSFGHTEEEQQALRARGVLIAGAAVCAEHMFAGKFPHQSPTNKAYIAGEHVAEMLMFAEHLAAKVPDWPAAEKTFNEDVWKVTEPLRKKAIEYNNSNGEKDPKKYLDTVHALMPKLLAHWPIRLEHAVSQMRRIYDKEMILDAQGLKAWTKEISNPPDETVKDWFDRITESVQEERDISPQEAAPAAGKAPRHINYLNSYRDARVLSQVEQLNRSSGDNTEYVLVTGARRLYLAFARWRHSRACHGMPLHKMAFLRHPRQFMPLTNVGEAGYDPVQSQERALRSTLEIFLRLYFKPEELPSVKGPERIPRFRDIKKIVAEMENQSQEIVDKSAVSIIEIRKKWLEIIEDSVIYHTSYLKGISPEALAPIALAADDEGVRNAIRDRISENLDAVELNQARSQQTQVLLRMLADEPEEGSRSQAYLCVPFPRVVAAGFRDINAFLAHLDATKDRETRDNLLKLVADESKRETGYEALLFLGYVCLQMNLFDKAIFYLDRARKKFKRTEDPEEAYYEIIYCLAVAIRYHDVPFQQFKTAAKYLKSCVEYHRKNYERKDRPEGEPSHHFRYLRDNYEAAALRFGYLTRRKALAAKNQIGDDVLAYEINENPDEMLESEITGFLQTAGALLDCAAPDSWETERYLQIGLKVAGIKCGELIYLSVLSRGDFVTLDKDDAARAVEMLEQKIEEAKKGRKPLHFIFHANARCLKWLNEEPGSGTRLHDAFALNRYLMDNTPRRLTPVDRYELDIIKERLKKELLGVPQGENEALGI